jgi:hypothetical protein
MWFADTQHSLGCGGGEGLGKHKTAIDSNVLRGMLEHGTNWTKANRKVWATDDINEILTKLSPIADQLIDAIDNENVYSFTNACTGAGLSNSLAMRVWDATMGSLDPQAAKPCW